MSLLNAVVGALAGAQGGGQGASGNPLGGLGALLGAAGGGQGGGAMPALLQAVVGMLGQGGQGGGGLGGLGGLLSQFQKAGLGDQVASWVSTGQNLPVSADQIQSALGSDTIGALAKQAGIGQGDASQMLSQLLPALVDHLTPQGQLPAAGGATGGGLDDLLGGLGTLLRR